ncbi:hypothetical protein [Streptomyces sp. B21-083]|uniref:hypothetical protein n=1 Tax=Streptomyces sp. B21-083 TaxID=3039410 RepID=UPI002FF21DAB
MTGKPRPGRLVVSLGAWWMLIAFGLWLVGKAVDQSASFVRCAASAAFLVAIGEAGDWLRRRWKAHHARAR